MSASEQQETHDQIMQLWERFRDLQKRLLVFQADVSDLDNDIKAGGKRIYALYRQSDDGLNGKES